MKAPVRSGEVIELFPIGELSFQVDVIGVVEELVELLLIGPMRPFDLSVELRGSRLDVGVPDAAVLDVPMELGLELVAAIGADALDAEGDLSTTWSTKSMALTWLCRL